MTNELLHLMATGPTGTADLLVSEMTGLGGEGAEERPWGVAFAGTLEVGYRACLWSRVASRVLLVLGEFPAPDATELYASALQIDWTQHLGPTATLAVDCQSVRSAVAHTQFAALKVKDAIVDQLRERRGTRPSIDTTRPAVRVHVRLLHDRVTFAIDLSGESLHRRGYRGPSVAAPLKENLAAALLLRSGWPEIAAAGGGFLDPLCGSGTLPIEAAMIAGDVAPGILRDFHGFLGWAGHDAPLWQRLLAEAQQRREAGALAPGRIAGSDRDPRSVATARENVERAGFDQVIRISRQELAAVAAPPSERGLLLTNPPYGERLGEVETLRPLYADLGAVMRERFVGWQAGIFTGNPALGRELKLDARRTHRLMNGQIECRLLRFDIAPASFTPERRPGRLPNIDPAVAERPGAAMFGNRLRKNLEALTKWATREDIACYRVYDADMPEYSFAIDLYGNDQRYAYVQEYAAPSTVDPARARTRREEALVMLPSVLGLDAERIFFRTRRKQKDKDQYNKLAEEEEFHAVREGGLLFLVNFTDYLDTGLFLDHRLTRARIREQARGKRFLNLFAYTGTATVYAAAGGARTTTTVDMSRTYLEWAERNLVLNQLGGAAHEGVQADCLEWLAAARPAQPYDLIFLDPPTFSNSKRMQGTFDVQRDHVALISAATRLLAPRGTLIFSTNFTKFKIDSEALAGLEIQDITRATIPRDYERNQKIHQCFEVKWRH